MYQFDPLSVQMTPTDIKNIREIAERDDVLELLARSLAPSIYGHDHIKKALVLQLLVSRPKLLQQRRYPSVLKRTIRYTISRLLAGLELQAAHKHLLRAFVDSRLCLVGSFFVLMATPLGNHGKTK